MLPLLLQKLRTRRRIAREPRRRSVKPVVMGLEARQLLAAWDVLSYHGDSGSSGLQTAETTLTPENVSVYTFGKVFSRPVDGQVYAEPLVKSGVNITVGTDPGVHDVVFVATENDSLYAIDAGSGNVLWQTSFINPAQGVTTVSPVDVGSSDISPQIGITSTPVIDASTNVIYVLAMTKVVSNGDTNDPHFVQTLHAIDLSTGAEALGGPVVVADTSYNKTTDTYTYNSGPYVVGTGNGAISVNGESRVYYNALRQNQRPALTLDHGTVYIASASFSDTDPYHGWVLGYNAANLALTGVLNTTPNGSRGGIWQSGGKLAADANGNLYFETGNGTFGDGSANPPLNAQGFPVSGNYGESFLKIAPDPTTSPSNPNVNGWGLKVVDYFTPHDQKLLTDVDADLGSTGTTLLPDYAGATIAPGVRQQLLVGSGKLGRIYVLDRNNMGKFDPTTDHIVQEIVTPLKGAFGTGAYFFGTAAYFAGTMYYVDGYDGMAKAFTLANGHLYPTPSSRSAASYNIIGATPTISSNGTSNAIVWTLDKQTNALHAYDASNLGRELYNSNQAPGFRDALGLAVKFTVPTVANGRVYAGSSNALVAYGLIAPASGVVGPLTPSEARAFVVTSLYHDILGRDPSPMGLNVWSRALGRGRPSRALATRLWFSPLHRRMVRAHVDPGIPLNTAIARVQYAMQSVRADLRLR